MLGLFVLLNAQFFIKQVGFWWQRDVRGQTPVVDEDWRGTPDRLVISAIGLEAPLVYIDDLGEVAFQAGLAQGVVHYPNTALPGAVGNAFYFGHSSDFPTKPGNYKTIFALLPQVPIDAEILLTNRSGRQFRYQVQDKQIVQPTQTEFLSQDTNGEKWLTLQTSYPVGTALQRYIVLAKLVEEVK